MLKKILFLTSLFILLINQAYADDNMYVGADVGGSQTYYNGYGRGGLWAAGLFAGYNFTPNIGLEAGYTSYPDALGNGGNVGHIAQQGADLMSVWSLHLLDHLSTYGKVGLSYMHAAIEEPGLSDSTANVWNLGYGFGFAYDINAQLITRFEWYRAEGASNAFSSGMALPDTDYYSFALAYRF